MTEQDHTPRGAEGNDFAFSEQAVTTLEAFADTVLPGTRRHPHDVAIAGVSDTPGCVEAGALQVLTDPATGIEEGVEDIAQALNEAAQAYASSHGLLLHPDLPFVSLRYPERRELVAHLTSETLEKDLWFLLALFANMAYDCAPHRDTAELLADPTHWSGLRGMGFIQIGARTSFQPASYGRTLSRPHPDTDSRGNLP